MSKTSWKRIRMAYSFGRTLKCIVTGFEKANRKGPARYTVTIGAFQGILLLKDLGISYFEADKNSIEAHIGEEVIVQIKMVYDDRQTFMAGPVEALQEQNKVAAKVG